VCDRKIARSLFGALGRVIAALRLGGAFPRALGRRCSAMLAQGGLQVGVGIEHP
jgi:hypothetical protein